MEMTSLKHVTNRRSASDNKAEIVFPEIQALRKDLEFKNGRSKCGSAPASRSNSFKNRPRPKAIQNVLDIPRRNSMPDTSGNFLCVEKEGEPLRRVRSFKMTSKGIVNRGDAFRHSNNSLNSTDSGKILDTEDKKSISRKSEETESRASSSVIPNVYKVALCGSVGVGKTALVNQFKTSEYMGGFEIAIGDVEDEMTVSVLLDGEESTLEFHDFTENQENLRHVLADAYVVVYSVNNIETFQIAKDTVHTLRKDMKTKSAIILVANKIDLVRKRLISSHEGRKLAEHNNCKYIETSVALNHQVDELLVGILRQIRLKQHPHKPERPETKPKVKRSGPLGLLDKLFGRRSKESSSCDNLYD